MRLNMSLFEEAGGFSAADMVYVDLALAELADVTDVQSVYDRRFPEGHGPTPELFAVSKRRCRSPCR
ncbi:hypothetical protein AB4Z34_33180 [Ensifer sp. 2YAB10]|uniref:hypothetical protein n=1 Tax=unclassified Ensifer TaxID=2633371 RepID=UPI0013B043B2